MNRRGFLGALLAAAAAPAIVRASSLMPVKAPAVWTPPGFQDITCELGSYEGIRFIESDHVMDAARYTGMGIVAAMAPFQHRMSLGLRDTLERGRRKMDEGALVIQREPALIVHSEWAADLRAAGVPVERKR
jgi:hypothetical protein